MHSFPATADGDAIQYIERCRLRILEVLLVEAVTVTRAADCMRVREPALVTLTTNIFSKGLM